MTTTPGSQAALRAANRRRVVRAVRDAGGLTQAQIARETGLSPATVSNVVRLLTARGVLSTEPTTSSGRRATRVTFDGSAGAVVGLDFGHRHLRGAVGDLSRQVLAEAQMLLETDRDAESGIDLAAELVVELLGRAGVKPERVRAVGVGLPGPIDVPGGVVGSSTILPGWTGLPLGRALSARLDRPVHVDNDANLGALAEATWGAARQCEVAVYLKASTGVGAGLVVNRRVFRGRSGTAGEIGHMTLEDGGAVCRCGNRGCLETLVGGPVLLELLRHSHGPRLRTLDEVVDRALGGDPGCRRVVADAGRHMGLAVANVTNLLNPERVVVGGDLARAGDLLLDPLREVVARHAIPAAASALSIVTSELGNRAEVLGALALALEKAEEDEGDGLDESDVSVLVPNAHHG